MRAALKKLRRDIKAAALKAGECISYQIPAFRLDGNVLVYFGAAARHCSFYPGALPIEALRDELETYDTRKGTIRFQADKPLPASQARKLVKARIMENERLRGNRNCSGLRRPFSDAANKILGHGSFSRICR